VIFSHAEGKPLSDELRSRLAGLAPAPTFDDQALFRLARQGSGPSVDLLPGDRRPQRRASPSPHRPCFRADALFPDALLIGRMRASGREIVVNAIPFSSKDWGNVSRYAEQVDRAFLPRPQGARPAIAVGNRHPEISLPAAFEPSASFSGTPASTHGVDGTAFGHSR
jgi:hypothetical protein